MNRSNFELGRKTSEKYRGATSSLVPNSVLHGLHQRNYTPVHPESRGGTSEESNLCLACRTCNLAKSNQIEAIDPLAGRSFPLFNPRTQTWNEHFQWTPDGAKLLGKTPVGRATIIALNLNNELAVAVRREWVRVGWPPPQEKP